MNRGRRRARGFTLIELMVAVSLLGVLLVLLFSAMRTGIRSWQAAEAHIAANEGFVQVERFLVRVISQAWPPEGLEGGLAVGGGSQNRAGVLFEGARDRIAFVAPGVAALPRAGLFLYEIYVDERGGEDLVGDLQVRMTPYRPGERPGGEPRLLRESVTAFEIRYFGVVQARGEPEWVDEWPDTVGRLPLLVEIRLQPADGPERPLIVAAPMAVAEEVP